MASIPSPPPAVLPLSTPQATTATATAQQTSAIRTFFTGVSETVRTGFANRRPWPEVLDRSAFSKPESMSDATHRIRKNYNYFRVNYLTVITSVLAISLLTNPLSLVLLAALLAAWLFLYFFRQSSDPITLFGRQFSERETLFFLLISTVVVIFLTSVGTVLVSALMVGVAIVCTHGAFRLPEDLFLDEPEPQNGAFGFLSFLAGGPTTASQPAVAVPARA
ncbi:PRA1 family protein B4-like [Andrographis paniculata]|uniref:PRA1 family protein B4-like n=1 Tax=Andrographis paniculata TaxID=175694 RepID=UPI0021E7020F|nr:PRA1 family protein B4-like [Andrographis paniculata]